MTLKTSISLFVCVSLSRALSLFLCCYSFSKDALPCPYYTTSGSGSEAMLALPLSFIWLALALLQPRGVSSGSLKVGAMLCLDTRIGNLSQLAIQMALEDQDLDQDRTLNLSVVAVNTDCSSFQGAAVATVLLKEEVVAVVGPQSSQVAHFVAEMGSATHVPFLSFAATDPSLSGSQYPYFFRISQSDSVQMEAVADVIHYYGWREIVALFSDDDYGANGIAALDSALVNVESRIVLKQAIPPGITKSGIDDILLNLELLEPRVFVVHMQQDGVALLAEVNYLQMMSASYIWIVTDSLLSSLDTHNSVEGIIGIRPYVPNSIKLDSFMAKWKERTSTETDLSEIIHSLYAYDCIQIIATALATHIKEGRSLDFEDPALAPTSPGGTSDLAKLKVFKGGPQLREQILNTKFQGLSGPILVDMKGDLQASSFEVVNVVQKEKRVIGYWSNQIGLSITPPDKTSNATKRQLLEAIWPGGGTLVPRGWVLPKNGKYLSIGVPRKAGYEQFVGWTTNTSNAGMFNGFCIDVFERAVKYLPYGVPYKFVPIGDGRTTPVYDDMIEMIVQKKFDAIVGDVTITTKRMEKVDFTQPYIDSGLVVVVPYQDSSHNYAWAFLRPFTPAMWFTTLAFFVFTGIAVWMLEHKKNHDFRGRPKKQLVTILWFSFSTLFFSHREPIKSILGRCAIVIWLFVVLIITSSYTANLTSILTVQQLLPSIQGINSLQVSNVPIGYQAGSFVKDYLIGLNIAKERLRPYNSIEEYAEALEMGPNRGGVSAIVDELPYVQVFLSSQCGFTITGMEFTKEGWGFAFPKDSEIAVDMSTAILTLSENGELQKMHDVWLSGSGCNRSNTEVDSTQLGLGSFWGLFLVSGGASFICLIFYTARLLCQFTRRPNDAFTREGEQSFSSRSKRFVKSFASYVNESAMDKNPGHQRCEENPQQNECDNRQAPL